MAQRAGEMEMEGGEGGGGARQNTAPAVTGGKQEGGEEEKAKGIKKKKGIKMEKGIKNASHRRAAHLAMPSKREKKGKEKLTPPLPHPSQSDSMELRLGVDSGLQHVGGEAKGARGEESCVQATGFKSSPVSSKHF